MGVGHVASEGVGLAAVAQGPIQASQVGCHTFQMRKTRCSGLRCT